MKRSLKSMSAAVLILALALLITVSAPAAMANDDISVCNKALVKCGVDAAIAGLLSGGTPMALLFMGCLIGYDWCLKYYWTYFEK